MFPFLPALIFLFLSGSSYGKGPADYAKFLDTIEALNVQSGEIGQVQPEQYDLCVELLTLAASIEPPRIQLPVEQEAAPVPAYAGFWAASPTPDSSRTRDGPAI
jgi:hypothetical protein